MTAYTTSRNLISHLYRPELYLLLIFAAQVALCVPSTVAVAWFLPQSPSAVDELAPRALLPLRDLSPLSCRFVVQFD